MHINFACPLTCNGFVAVRYVTFKYFHFFSSFFLQRLHNFRARVYVCASSSASCHESHVFNFNSPIELMRCCDGNFPIELMRCFECHFSIELMRCPDEWLAVEAINTETACATSARAGYHSVPAGG